MNTLSEVQQAIEDFAQERDWDKFHTPKNLAMALSVEAAELLEHFQWLSEEESKQLSPEKLAQVQDEAADIFVYLLRIADKLNINLLSATTRKMEKNRLKYPIDKAYGKATKYTEYDNEPQR